MDARDHTFPEASAALTELLSDLERPGEFYAHGETLSPLPQVDVDGVGTLPFPLPAAVAAELIAVAERAPYGRGPRTLVDTDIRRAWQIAADRVRIGGSTWQATLLSIVRDAAAGLGVAGEVSAELYKMLVYDEGSFFVAHRDSEKTSGMFGTLVVLLPSLHQGGQLVVRHEGREVVLPLHGQSLQTLSWGAFYADCTHELLPVTKGYRVSLVYNLVKCDRIRPRCPIAGAWWQKSPSSWRCGSHPPRAGR